ncbi:hypothetical protein F8388_009746 [Cannabis sativa]|uniref:Uncharacterized protein n=1 Tax=Cannabis sativa TaxID=3483 RepID=A0A7J6H332_CANSA|nr:hypothetical protein G4B88_008763 [Cannabis sativa]KAF4389613.1 hypothetical protein F8388_009746 [Cannabis sativa]
MGAGGKNSRLERAPHTTPPFTLSQLKKAIPPHCFNRSLLRSFSHVLQDLFFVFLFYYIATSYFHLLPHPLQYLAWPLYWIFQGSIFAGIWVLGHDCGHQAFSDHQWVDDTVGFVLHSALLFPYFSCKYSHRRHHSNIGSLEHDQLFVPVPKSQIAWLYKHYLDNPLGRALQLSIMVFLGFPLYLGFNLTGKSYDRSACHYDPYSPLYSKSERLHILMSDISIFITALMLYQLGSAKGLSWIMFVYGMPLFIGNSIIVIITYLNHTHSSLPHYDSSEWDWLKGALSTIDRNYGSILNRVFHHLTDAHVAHHLFATIPHYHANEATRAIKPLLGEYYSFDDTPIIKALWRETKECVYIEPNHESSPNNNKGVFWYNNKF